MRLWTYILPAGLWLWLVHKRGEKIPVGECVAYDGGNWLVINVAEARTPAPPEAGELPKGWRKLGHDESGKFVGIEPYCQECALSPRFGICCICGRPAPPEAK